MCLLLALPSRFEATLTASDVKLPVLILRWWNELLKRDDGGEPSAKAPRRSRGGGTGRGGGRGVPKKKAASLLLP